LARKTLTRNKTGGADVVKKSPEKTCVGKEKESFKRAEKREKQARLAGDGRETKS